MAYFSDLVPRNLEREFDLCVTKTTSTPISTSEDTSCPICMEYITDKDKTTTSCGHVFHSSCIFQNMMLRTSCPMCREDLICKQIPIASNTNSNTNINININYNLSQNHSLMDIDDDIINALLSQDMLSQEILSQELYYDEPPINDDDANDNETVNESESNSQEEESDSVSDTSSAYEENSDDDETDGVERFETDLSLSDVTNKMLELGYTSEDMFYYMSWRVNPFYFNMQYLNKYNDEFYNTMTETMHKIFSKEIPITTNSELQYNSTPMTIDELN
jgi:cobalamin biosynthesis protein CobT